MENWDHELMQWMEFKAAQRIHNQYDRSELELELEDTDAALIGVLSKLNDWQEFRSRHLRNVQEAEKVLEECQQGIARTYNAMVTAANTDAMIGLPEPARGWMSCMRDAQKRLDAAQNKLKWVENQWTEIVEEAYSSIAAAPKLQKELEAKVEKQAKAIYRALLQKGARPSHRIYSPNKDIAFPQKLQHWISESSVFAAELRDWRLFISWRRDIRDAGNMGQDGRKVLSEGDSCPERFEDHVRYKQHELEKAMSWVDCWRRQARKHVEASRAICQPRGSSTSCETIEWLSYGRHDHMDDHDHDDDDDVSSDDECDIAEARRAELYAKHAEEKVSVAAKRLEESKQKLQDILAESSPPLTSGTPPAYTETQTPYTPPKSPSGKGSGANDHRRSKKERAREREADMAHANTEQHALSKGSSSSNKPNEDDEDTQMSTDAEDPSSIEIKTNPKQTDSEDVVMSDAEDCADLLPSSPPGSYSWSIPQINHTTLPPPSPPSPISRRTRSATKPDQVLFSKVLKKPTKNKPSKKAKVFTEQQQMALLHAAATEHTTAAPTPLEKVEQNPDPPPPTSTPNSQISSSPSSRPPGSKKTRPAQEPNQVSSRKIQKPSKKDQLRKKAKTFTEEQTQILLHAATSSCHSTEPTSPDSPVTATYPTTTTSFNKNKIQSPGSPSLTSRETLSTKQLDDTLSSEPHKDSNRNQSRKKVKKVTQQHTPALKNAASPNYPPTIPRRSERLKQKVATSKKMA